MTIEKIEELTEFIVDSIKWGNYETAISRLNRLKDMIDELKEDTCKDK